MPRATMAWVNNSSFRFTPSGEKERRRESRREGKKGGREGEISRVFKGFHISLTRFLFNLIGFGLNKVSIIFLAFQSI